MYFWPRERTWCSMGMAFYNSVRSAEGFGEMRDDGLTYQLLRDGDLLELQLVDVGLGGAQQDGRGEESALHRDRRPRLPSVCCFGACVLGMLMLGGVMG